MIKKRSQQPSTTSFERRASPKRKNRFALTKARRDLESARENVFNPRRQLFAGREQEVVTKSNIKVNVWDEALLEDTAWLGSYMLCQSITAGRVHMMHAARVPGGGRRPRALQYFRYYGFRKLMATRLS